MSYIHGIDVSSWDPYIDWQKVRNQDIRFAIIKSTEGLDFFSKSFNDQWDGAKSVGILRGSYHYLHAAQDGAKQADFFLSKVNVQDGDLPPFLDVEGTNNAGATNSQFIGNSQKWLERVEQQTGRKPIVYSTASFLKEKLTGNNGQPPPWASNYQTWMAQYFNSYSADAGGQPTQPTGWGDWILWQYSGDHDSLDGIYQDAAKTKLVRVDLNVYRYSIDQLYSLAKAQQPVDANVSNKGPVQTPPIVTPPMVTPPIQAPPSNHPPVQTSPATHPPVQTPAPVAPQPGSTITYTIQTGDTLWAISNKFGVTMDSIVKLNNIANPNLIHVGEVLHIPGK